MALTQSVLKAILVPLGLGGWFWTQARIGRRISPRGRIDDRLHDLTAPVHRFLSKHPGWADGLLVATSAWIDLLGISLVALAIFGPTVRPLLGVLLLFALRQLCQGLCSLPPPDGMIWRYPGVPSLLVTYGTASDLFFSGHTAIAVYGCLELGRFGGPLVAVATAGLAVVEATTVLALRAHYTMDVFAGAVTALWIWTVASAVAPGLDSLLSSVAR
jgi:PAP2 superfamily protein